MAFFNIVFKISPDVKHFQGFKRIKNMQANLERYFNAQNAK